MKSEPTVNLGIYFPEDLIKRVDKMCEKMDITFDDFVKVAIDEYVKKFEKE